MEKRINEKEFINPRGIGSEIPHYVLDYPATDETQVRIYIKSLLERTHLNIKEINLFHFLLSLFEEDEVEELIEISEEEGFKGISDVVGPILNEEETLVDSFIEETEDAEIIFITGVGNAYPFLKSSQLLSLIANKGYRKPIVLFYPGYFTGLELKLFNILNNEDKYQLSRIS